MISALLFNKEGTYLFLSISELPIYSSGGGEVWLCVAVQTT